MDKITMSLLKKKKEVTKPWKQSKTIEAKYSFQAAKK